jgi:amino acid transporter
MRRTIATIPLLFTSISAILGSGWLFSIYYTASFAGPSSLIAWILGGVGAIIIAFIYAELCSMLPITGSSARIPHYTHGSVVSFVFAWMIWLSYAALVPTEVQAVIQYLSYYYPGLITASSGLTTDGYITATVLMLAVSILNIYSLRWLIRCNNALTVLKIVIPVFISLIIIYVFFVPSKVVHTGGSPFAPFGIKGIFSALTSGGVVFAFNGFKQACEIAGEAKNPRKALPIAVVGSVLVCLAIFLLLQVAFLSSLNTANLINGWSQISLQRDQSPLASIVVQDGFDWLLPLLYFGAIVAPLAAALMYCNSSSRSLYGMSKNGYLPKFFQHLTGQGNPVYAIIANFAIGMLMFAPLPGWNKMITFLTSLMAITYAVGPVCLLSLRYQLPHKDRPFKLPFDKLWASIAFYICTLLTYWTGWEILSKLGISIFVSLVILSFYHLATKRGNRVPLDWRPSLWIWPYFLGIMVLSYLGSFGGGINVIPFGWDALVIAVFCIGILIVAVRYRLPTKTTEHYIESLHIKGI